MVFAQVWVQSIFLQPQETEAWDSHKLQIPGLSYNWWGFQAWDTLQDSTDNSSTDKAETSWDWQEYFSQLQDTTHAFSCHIRLPVCLWIMDPHSRAPEKNTSHVNEVLPQDTTHLIQRPCYQRGSSCQDPAGNWTTRRSPDDRKETQTAVVWSCFPFIRSGPNHLARHSERGKKTRRTKIEVEWQHQGMDRLGVRQVPEGSGEQGKMEKTGCKIICGAPPTLAVKGLMMMMMIYLFIHLSIHPFIYLSTQFPVPRPINILSTIVLDRGIVIVFVFVRWFCFITISFLLWIQYNC